MWLLAGVPVALTALGMAVSLVAGGVSRYLGQRALDDIAATDASAAREANASASVPAGLTGEAVDLSTVMGRARKLANQWQPEVRR